MKISRILQYVVGVLPLALVLFFWSRIPDSIPAHYTFTGQVDRWGSKNELLILPAVALFAAFLADYAAASRVKRGQPEIARSLRLPAFLVQGLILLFTAFSVYTAYGQIEELFSREEPWLVSPVNWVGIVLVVLGAVMPFVPRNQFFGLRTSWTLESDTVWRKSQRFGGLIAMISGVVLLVLSTMLQSDIYLVVTIVVVLLMTIATVIYSWNAAKEERDATAKK